MALRTLLSILSIGFMMTSCGESAADDAAALDAYYEAFSAAYEAGEFDALRDLYEPDVWVMSHDRPARRGVDEVIAYYKATRRPGASASMKITVEDRVIDGDVAFQTALWRLELPGAVDRAPLDAGRSFVVFKKGTDEKWRVWRHVDNQTPDAPVAGESASP
ncbi:MAG: nuclear transport factor 2 family protein [Pseudomonadota bacterium]